MFEFFSKPLPLPLIPERGGEEEEEEEEEEEDDDDDDDEEEDVKLVVGVEAT
jgi:NACalpha-BTF3-like transcription factor